MGRQFETKVFTLARRGSRSEIIRPGFTPSQSSKSWVVTQFEILHPQITQILLINLCNLWIETPAISDQHLLITEVQMRFSSHDQVTLFK